MVDHYRTWSFQATTGLALNGVNEKLSIFTGQKKCKKNKKEEALSYEMDMVQLIKNDCFIYSRRKREHIAR